MAKDRAPLKVLAGIILVAVINIAVMVTLLSLYGPVTKVVPSLADAYGITYMVTVFGGLSFYQLLYIVPLGIWLRRSRRADLAKGMILGAVLTALLCSACFLVFFRF